MAGWNANRGGVLVDVDVAVAYAGLDHRHGRTLDDTTDEPLSPARVEHVDDAAGGHQVLEGLV